MYVSSSRSSCACRSTSCARYRPARVCTAVTSDSPESCADSAPSVESLLHQRHARLLDLGAQRADARVGVGLAAGLRVGVGRSGMPCRLVFGVGQLLVVVVDLAVDELVGLAALAFLRREAFLDEELGEALGDVERALAIAVAVGDLDQVVARARDRGAVLDLLDDLVLADRRGILRGPAAGLEDLRP